MSNIENFPPYQRVVKGEGNATDIEWLQMLYSTYESTGILKGLRKEGLPENDARGLAGLLAMKFRYIEGDFDPLYDKGSYDLLAEF